MVRRSVSQYRGASGTEVDAMTDGDSVTLRRCPFKDCFIEAQEADLNVEVHGVSVQRTTLGVGNPIISVRSSLAM